MKTNKNALFGGLLVIGLILTDVTAGHAQPVTFSAAANFAVGVDALSVAVGDFNGDGKLDLAMANFSSDTVSILLGTGTGRFGGRRPTSGLPAFRRGGGFQWRWQARSGGGE